jgi:hypothetical protein
MKGISGPSLHPASMRPPSCSMSTRLCRETAKAEEPQPKEREEEWKQRLQKRQRLLELRAEEIKATGTLQLFLDAYQDLQSQEQRQGKLFRLVRGMAYGLFGPFLEPPQQETLSRNIETRRQAD